MAEKTENLFRVKCPNCGYMVVYKEGDERAMCEACDTTFSIAEATASVGGANANSAVADGGAVSLISSIDNSDSALAYLDSFFEGADWNEFYKTPALTFSSIDKMVEKILIKSAASPASWELAFNSLSVPLAKKVEGLNSLEKEFLDEYVKKSDLTEVLGVFELYSKISARLVNEKDALNAKLAHYIKFAEKYGVNEETVAQMKQTAANVDSLLSSVKIVKNYKDLKGFDAAERRKQTIIADKLAKKGIQAEEVYTRARESYRNGDRSNAVLRSFKSIYGYKDSKDYVNELDDWLYFSANDKRLVKLADKFYYVRSASAPVFTVSTANNGGGVLGKIKGALGGGNNENSNPYSSGGQSEETPAYSMRRLEIAEIVDGKPAKTPIVGDITKFIAHYGKYLYFIKNNKCLCVFDSSASKETAVKEVYPAQEGDFEDINGEIKPFYYGVNMFLRVKLRTSPIKQGCFASLFKKKAESVVNQNNYSLIKIDLSTSQSMQAIPEIVDVMDVYGEEMFFKKSEKIGGIDREKFCAYNIETGGVDEILGSDCEIRGVIDGKIVYMTWMPTSYNKDLYVIDVKTKEKTLLESNVYKFFSIIDDKVYYIVGNSYNGTLFSILPDGTNRTQVLLNAQNVANARIINGWFYVAKGTEYNRVLLKISVDGKKRVPLCAQYKSLVAIKEGVVFYLDTYNCLCAVKVDGTDCREIAEDVLSTYVYENEIYIVRAENGTYSLYRIDIEGNNIKKVIYDVGSVVKNGYDDNGLYIYRTVRVNYAIHTPIDKDNYVTDYENIKIEKFALLNRNSGEIKDILTLGEPEKTASEFKSGCLRKKITKESIIEVVPNKIEIKRKGVAEAGAVYQELNADNE